MEMNLNSLTFEWERIMFIRCIDRVTRFTIAIFPMKRDRNEFTENIALNRNGNWNIDVQHYMKEKAVGSNETYGRCRHRNFNNTLYTFPHTSVWKLKTNTVYYNCT